MRNHWTPRGSSFGLQLNPKCPADPSLPGTPRPSLLARRPTILNRSITIAFFVMMLVTVHSEASIVDDIKEVTRLHREGHLTPSEFTTAKARILMKDLTANVAHVAADTIEEDLVRVITRIVELQKEQLREELSRMVSTMVNDLLLASSPLQESCFSSSNNA